MRATRVVSPDALALGISAVPRVQTVPTAPESNTYRYAPVGPLALRADAFGATYYLSEPDTGSVRVSAGSPVAVVEIVGPLMHHEVKSSGAGVPRFDSYDAIKNRFLAAASAPGTKFVLLSIDSPGGLVAGCFDTVLELRKIAASYGVEIVAYIDAQCSSAAYAIACAADRIYIPTSGVTGSIGIIDTLSDQIAVDKALGLNYVIVTSGQRKADGNPHVAITEEAVAAAQQMVDVTAAQFWALVSERRGISVDAVRDLQCAQFCGQKAIDAGLADAIATFDEVVALLASTEKTPAREGTKGATTMSGLADAKAALKSVADDETESEDNRKEARKMLAALDAPVESDEDKKKKEEESKAKAESDKKEQEAKAKAEGEPPPKEPDADDKNKEGAGASAVEKSLMALAAQVNELTRDKQLKAETDERRTLLASRPDLEPGVAASIADLKLPDLRRMCAKPGTVGALPLGPGKAGQVGAARAAINATPTIGANANLGAPNATMGLTAHSDMSGRGNELDEAMGISKPAGEIKMVGNTLQLGVMAPEQAREYIRANAKKGGLS